MSPYEIALIVVAIVAGILGGLLKHFVNLIRQSGELLTGVADAFEDGKLTKKELVAILKEAKDVADAWGKVLKAISKEMR